jgi:hypothetical protein
MPQLNVKLTYNEREQNWSVEISGKSYDFITIESVKKLLKDALIDSEKSLLGRDAIQVMVPIAPTTANGKWAVVRCAIYRTKVGGRRADLLRSRPYRS